MKEIAILPKLYDLIQWYSKKYVKYPKTYKYSLGERINNILFYILELIIEAKFSSKKKSYYLRTANIEIEKLRYAIRISKDLQCITLKEYEYAAKEINEIGKMAGGWVKYSEEIQLEDETTKQREVNEQAI